MNKFIHYSQSKIIQNNPATIVVGNINLYSKEFSNLYFKLVSDVEDIMFKEYKAKGLAKCYPEDQYDLTIGFTLANLKAKLKTVSKVGQDLKSLQKDISSLLDFILKQEKDITEIKNHLESKINYISKEVK